MINPLKFPYVAIAAVMLPGVVVGVSLLRSGESFRGLIEWVPLNWATVAVPQLFVIAVAILFPQLRRRFATRALVLQTILFLIFWYITSLDPNGPMLWVFYFGFSVLLLMVLALLPSSTENAREL
jgi:hypothetical protein